MTNMWSYFESNPPQIILNNFNVKFDALLGLLFFLFFFY